MNDQNKAELRRLAEAATQGRWATDGDNVNQHDNVIGHYVAHEKGGRIAEAFANCLVRTDAKCRANAAFIAAANPAAVLSLLDENEQLRNQLRLSGVSSELAIHDQVGRAVTGQLSAEIERDQLRAEVEALRQMLLEASEEIDSWGSYASKYFQEKHDLEGAVARFHRAAMTKEGSANG